MEIRIANQQDLEELLLLDPHIQRDFLIRAIIESRVFLAETEGIVGWLRYSYFWETIPFMDMLVVKKEMRQRGYGSKLVHFFEKHVKDNGFQRVMTSTSAIEQGQHLYYRLGYQAVGGFSPANEPYELLLSKEL